MRPLWRLARQEVHECIRRHSQDVTRALKEGAERNDLLERLQADPLFSTVDFARVLDSRQFVGRAPQQVDEFIEAVVEPIRRRYPPLRDQTGEVSW